MNKVIRGKRYDTKTAKLLGVKSSDLSPTDFGYWEEALYKTKSGNYFLYGEGGPASRYAVNAGNSSSSGEEIRAYSLEQAQQWVEDHLSADDYEQIFGEIDEEKIKITADVTPGTKDKLETLKSSSRKSYGDVIEYLLKFVDQEG